MTVVSNTSPLIFLVKIDRLPLLSALYEQIVIPRAVIEEIESKSTADTRRIRRWRDQSGIYVRSAPVAALEQLPSDVGSGERAVIALGLDLGPDLVLLDDQEGRRIARDHQLTVKGTIGVLVEAREAGHIASLRSELNRLVDAGLWISEAFYDRLVSEFGEDP